MSVDTSAGVMMTPEWFYEYKSQALLWASQSPDHKVNCSPSAYQEIYYNLSSIFVQFFQLLICCLLQLTPLVEFLGNGSLDGVRGRHVLRTLFSKKNLTNDNILRWDLDTLCLCLCMFVYLYDRSEVLEISEYIEVKWFIYRASVLHSVLLCVWPWYYI